MPLYREDYQILEIPEPSEVIETANMYMEQMRAERNAVAANLYVTDWGELKLELNASDIDLANHTLVRVMVPGSVASSLIAYLRNKGFSIKVDGLIVKVDKQTVAQGLVRFRYGKEGELESDVEVLFALNPNLWAVFVENELAYPEEWSKEH